MSRFTPLADGCVRDNDRLHRDAEGNLYALEWTPTLGDERVSFTKAPEIAAACTLAGGGWRMPEVRELAGLVDYTRFDPAIDKQAFPDTKSSWYWTATVDASSPADYAWRVAFNDGRVDYLRQFCSGFVRACRRVPPGQ